MTSATEPACPADDPAANRREAQGDRGGGEGQALLQCIGALLTDHNKIKARFK